MSSKRHFLKVSDLILLNDYSPASATREMKFLRVILNKKRLLIPKGKKSPIKNVYQKITIKEYCELNAINETELRTKLNI